MSEFISNPANFIKKKVRCICTGTHFVGPEGFDPSEAPTMLPGPIVGWGGCKTPLRTSTLGVYGASITAPLAFNVNELDSGGSRKNIWETGGGAGWPLIIWEE